MNLKRFWLVDGHLQVLVPVAPVREAIGGLGEADFHHCVFVVRFKWKKHSFSELNQQSEKWQDPHVEKSLLMPEREMEESEDTANLGKEPMDFKTKLAHTDCPEIVGQYFIITLKAGWEFFSIMPGAQVNIGVVFELVDFLHWAPID